MIVAIEPDRRRAAQLTGMAHAHLRDELLVAPTAAQAVDVLNGRVPDVLLTAPLLSSQEETAIHEYLRQLGTAAAHVQTLTIPLLASASDERDRPVFSAFRRGRSQQHVEAEGCDPAVFAEQITEYLREARERKVIVPVIQRAPAAEAVETTPEPALTDASDPGIDVASFAIEDAPPRVSGRKFKELLARFDVTDVDEPIVSTSLDGPPAARHESAPSTPELVIPVTVVTETVPALDADPVSKRRQKLLPQDNWAFFDPNQCGFPALIAKLDEIASRDGDG